MTQLPHTFSYIVAILINDHFESPSRLLNENNFNNKYFKLPLVNHEDNDKMSLKISVLICKNFHEVVRVITNHYKKCLKGPPLFLIRR
jgi:hypothetical protein